MFSSPLKSPIKDTSIEPDTQRAIATYIEEGYESHTSFKEYCDDNSFYFGYDTKYRQKCYDKKKYFKKVKTTDPKLWKRTLFKLGLSDDQASDFPAEFPSAAPSTSASNRSSDKPAFCNHSSDKKPAPSSDTMPKDQVQTEDGEWGFEYTFNFEDPTKMPFPFFATHESQLKVNDYELCGKVTLYCPILDYGDFLAGLYTAKLLRDRTKIYFKHPHLSGGLLASPDEIFHERTKGDSGAKNETDALGIMATKVGKGDNLSLTIFKAPGAMKFDNRKFNGVFEKLSSKLDVKKEVSFGKQRGHPAQLYAIVEAMVEGSIKIIRDQGNAEMDAEDADFLNRLARVCDVNEEFVDNDRETRGIDPPDHPNNVLTDTNGGPDANGDDRDSKPATDGVQGGGDSSSQPRRDDNNEPSRRKLQFKPNTTTTKELTVHDTVKRNKAKRDAKVNKNRQRATQEVAATTADTDDLDANDDEHQHIRKSQFKPNTTTTKKVTVVDDAVARGKLKRDAKVRKNREKATQEAAITADHVVQADNDLDINDEQHIRKSHFKTNTSTTKKLTVDNTLRRGKEKRDAKVRKNREKATQEAAVEKLVNDNFVSSHTVPAHCISSFPIADQTTDEADTRATSMMQKLDMAGVVELVHGVVGPADEDDDDLQK